MVGEVRVLDLHGLQGLIEALASRGYTVVGPRVRDGAIVMAPIAGIDDLPRGWGDEQDAGRYRLRPRGDDALFGFVNGPQGAKPLLFPADELLWRARRTDGGFTVQSPGPEDAGQAGAPGPYAFIGLRDCDLRAVRHHDAVLSARVHADTRYDARRAGAFTVAVTCSDPSGTCFCVSMGGGPRPGAGYDLALTEILGDGEHRFLVETGSERGAEVLADVVSTAAAAADVTAADEVARTAQGRMGRTLDTDGIKEVLYASAESPVWDEVASRCLACTSCTLVCPTCFCTGIDDVTDLTGETAERHRVWDSCFTERFSFIHDGVVRESTSSRYRQWITHKLASTIDQFGASACVGCGRCITWCPAAIDITVEAARLRADLVEASTGGGAA